MSTPTPTPSSLWSRSVQSLRRLPRWASWSLLGAGLAAAATLGATQLSGEAASGLAADGAAAFELSHCQLRLLDGSPALALSFSQPLDRRQNLNERLRVTDLGPLSGAKESSQESGQETADNTNPVVAPKLSQGSKAPTGKLVSGSWVVGDNPRIAYFPYIQPQRRFQLNIGAGVLSVDAAKLAQAQECELNSEAMAASFYFASRGVVLPTGQNGGLPVVTVNTPEVDVQFLKVEGSALPKFLERVAGVPRRQAAANDDAASAPDAQAEGSEGQEGEDGYYSRAGQQLKGAVNGWELDALRESTRSVYLGRFATGSPPNKRQVSFLPVEGIKELQEPGVYIAVMGQPGRFAADYQVSYFYVSDIGVHARRYSQTLDAFATSLKSGEALGGVRFELLDENARLLAQVAADASGHAHFNNVPASASLLLARRGEGSAKGEKGEKGEMSVVVLREPGLDLSEFDTSGHPSRKVKLFAYAGRDLYRPGERFDLSVLVRNPDGKLLAPMPITATLKRPDGRSVSTSVWRPDDKRPGYLQRSLQLPPDAATGTWLLELRADPGAKQADTVWKFQVEEFLPERMKLALKTATSALAPGENFSVQVQGDYLYGAPAAGNRLLVSAFTERLRQALPQQWPGFIFGDFADDSVRKREELAEQTLDDKGGAQTRLPLPELGNSPLRVRGSFSLLESGGRPVVRSVERSVWPVPKLLALRPLFERDVAAEDGKAEFELIRVDANGTPQPLARAPLRLLREDRQYYWRFDAGRGWQSGFTQTDEVVEASAAALSAGRIKLSLPVRYGSYRLEIDDPETGKTLRYRFYAGWGAQDAEAMGNRPDRVQLKLAKAPLKVGETAQLHIIPPHDGNALVVVEGDGLLWSQRVAVKATGTTVEIPVDAAWARHDLYIGVTAFRPGSQGERVTPSRAVGLLHLPLAREERQIKLQIQAPAKVQPEKRVLVKIRAEGLGAQAGQSALVTLSAVDVGILNISRYATPDAFDFFFGKHRYAADVLDIYGKLIEKLDGTLAKLAFGGDSKNRADSKSLPKKVKLVDLFSGPVAFNAKGEAEVALDIPDFNGTLRLMAVAATPERFGKAEVEMVSAAPLVAELSTPRFISPGDAASVALDVTNLTTSAQELKLTLEGSDPVRVTGGEKTFSLQPQQRTTLRFGVEATDAYGLGRLSLRLSSASGLLIQRESALQVQPLTPPEREVRRLRLEPGANFKLDPTWLDKYHKGSATLSLSVSNQPPINVRRLVQGLLDYPYGCAEQTTSAAYPHLYIDEAGAQATGLPVRSREQRAQFVEGAVARLAGMQKTSGGFTLWGSGAYEGWLSSYITGFLLDARAQGFSVPEPMVKSAQSWLLSELQQAPNRFPALPAAARNLATNNAAASAVAGNPPPIEWRDYNLIRDGHQRFAELAFAGYMLAREQRAPLAQLRYLHDQVRDRARSPLPLVHLALALKLMGDENRAKVALNEAMTRRYGIQLKTSGWWGDEWLGDYGSPVRDLALSYALLLRHKVSHPQRENLLFDLAARLGSRNYYSTQERLALFLAARELGAQSSGEWAVLLNTAGAAPQALSSKTTLQRSISPADLAKGMSLNNQHSGALFLEVEMEGYPRKAPAPKADVMEVSREWFDADGRRWPAGRQFKVGDLLFVKLAVRARLPVPDAMLIDRVPAGFEIENLNLSQGEKLQDFSIGGVNPAAAMQNERIKHTEYRDDRFVAAVRLDGNSDWLNVFYMLRVVSPGRFVVPPTYAEDMYRAELRAVGAAAPDVLVGDAKGVVPASPTKPLRTKH